jgi:hypothetical protein
MTNYRSLFCDDEARRVQVLESDLDGIDYIEVPAESLDAQRFLHVYFLDAPPVGIEANTAAFGIQGGVRIRDIRVLAVAREDDHLVVEVDRTGDFSTYTLVIDSAGLDPVYAQCDFSFKAGCPTRLDCKSEQICPPEPVQAPPIDYLAKDYASFRQALIDLIPTLLPDWKERRAADLGIALVELLAYAGDHLSYFQDAVANEAYLETARQRESVRRHARLIDYRLHDGVSARAFVHIQVNNTGTVPAGTSVVTRIISPLTEEPPPHGPEIDFAYRQDALDAADAVFETQTDAVLHPALNEIVIWAWGNRQCCLPKGTTSVDLVGNLAADPSTDPPDTWRLKPGDFLLLEEMIGPETGSAADADPLHRQVVRLISVQSTYDPLLEQELTRVTWDRADALTFPLCISARLDDGTQIDNVSVARGNLVIADHGRTVSQWYPGDPHASDVAGISLGRRAFRFRLEKGPLSFRIHEKGPDQPVSRLMSTDPAEARPQVLHLEMEPDPAGLGWSPVMPDLLASGPLDRHFVVEVGNDGRALIRFGDDVYGMAPPDGAHLVVTYRVGAGKSGQVGNDTLAHVIGPEILGPWPDIAAVRNPLPAWGGLDPQSVEQVKQQAPAAFHAEQFRAVIEQDYADAATKHPEVSKAVATFRWTGSWHTVFITVDPAGRFDLPPELQQRVKDWVNAYTLAGYDLEIDPPIFVPLDLVIEVCVARDHFRAHVQEALLSALSNRILPDGRYGFFHPDNFTFGQPLYLSRLYAAVVEVQGVESAMVRRFVRRYDHDPDPDRPRTRANLDQGHIVMNRLEVLRLDNDPSFPENGILQFNMLGGK